MVQTDSDRVELEGVRLMGDTLFGLVRGAGAGSARPAAIALSRVSRAAVRETDLYRTAAVIALGLVVVAGLGFILAFRQGLSLWYDEIAEIDD